MKNLTIFFCFIISVLCFAQNTEISPELERQLKIADKLMKERSYYNAIEKYVQFDKAHPGNEDVVFKLGFAYYITRDYKNAEKYLTRYTTNKEYKKYQDALFYLAEVYKNQMKYDDAQANFIKYSRLKPKSPESKNYIKFAKNEINACEWVKNVMVEDSTTHQTSRLLGAMNRAYSDFSPYPISNDTLIFASMQEDSILNYSHDDNHFHAVKLYETVKKDSSWTEPFELVEYNSNFEHTANGVLSPDGKYFYFTRCKPNRDNKIVCDIYYTINDADKVKQHKVKSVSGINLDDYNTTQPSFQIVEKKDKKGNKTQIVTLYFSSDRPGGQGGRDIWFAPMLAPGKFKTPANCGNKINTPRDEVTPFYDSENGTLYFSSNYHFGFGGFDIHKAIGKDNKWQKPENIHFPLNSSYDDTYYTPYQKKAIEEEVGFIVSNRPGGIALHSETCCDDIYYFKEKFPEKIKIKGLVSEWFNPKDSIKKISSDASKILVSNSSKSIDTSLILKDTLVKKVSLEKVRIGYIKKKVYENQLRLNDTSFASLKELVVWEDTTNKGGRFELSLPKNRTYYLVSQKEGYSPKVQKLDTQYDTADVVLNRIKIVKKDTLKKVVEKLTADLDASKIKDDEKFVLDNVYFDTDKDVIRKDALPALNILLRFLNKNPKVKIEISGHTDNHGSDEHNLDLSQRRAESVLAWLVENDIDEKRLTSKGFGETQPIAPNTNSDGSDNPEGRAMNRRTEIKVLTHK